LAQRLIETLTRPYDLVGHQVVVGTSIGIALAPNDADDGETLLKKSDTALYRAKADGRGTFRFFEAEMDARLRARRLLELDLRRSRDLASRRADRRQSFPCSVSRPWPRTRGH